MKKNMGISDRMIRILVAVTIAILYFAGILSGTVAIVLLVVSGLFILTGFVGICPAYMPFKFKTMSKKND
jgi:hypothetical protein